MANPEQSQNLPEPSLTWPEPQNIGGRSFFKEILRQIKRPISVLARSGLALAVMMTGAQLLEKAGPISADAPQPVRNSAEWSLQDAETVFANLKMEKWELEQKPIEKAVSPFLQTDSSGKATAIWTVSEGYNPDSSKAGKVLYKSPLEASGVFSRFKPLVRVPFDARSVVAWEENVLIGGIQDWETRLSFSRDGGKTLTPVPNLPVQFGEVSEIRWLPNINRAIISFPGFETAGSVGIFNPDTQTVTEGLWPNDLGGTRGGLSVAEVGSGQIRILASAMTGAAGLSEGYVDITLNLLTGQASKAELKHRETGYAFGFTATKDASGQFDRILINNSDWQFYVIDAKTDTVAAPLFIGSLLNNRNIPNYIDDSTNLNPVQLRGDYVWAGGAYNTFGGEARAILLSWPLGANPNARPDLVTVYRLEDDKDSYVTMDGDLQFGVFNTNAGLLTNIYGLGFGFTEAAIDGKPIPGVSTIYLGRGVRELPPVLPPPPVFRTYLPELTRNSSGG